MVLREGEQPAAVDQFVVVVQPCPFHRPVRTHERTRTRDRDEPDPVRRLVDPHVAGAGLAEGAVRKPQFPGPRQPDDVDLMAVHANNGSACREPLIRRRWAYRRISKADRGSVSAHVAHRT